MKHLLYPILALSLLSSCSGQTARADGGQPRDAADSLPADSMVTDTLEGSDRGTSVDTASDILSATHYTAADSARIEQLLRMDTGSGSDVLFYARQFKGVPYVASTLEVCDPERLVVNLRGLDCTTLVETAMALAMTRREGRTDFASYCRNLMRLRYRGGRLDGYLSRLHYFTWWMHDHLESGLIGEVKDGSHFTAPIRVDNHYMSRHADKYRLLREHPEWVDSIRSMEERLNGPDGTYLPEASVGLPRKELACIHDGDLIAIVTRKDGLDYSHLGLAVWGRDGLLHLLNASSIHHKVVEEPKTLRQYLRDHPSSIGIRVFRLR